MSCPPMYSAGGIRLLSLLGNTVVGGVMTAQNLKDIEQPGAARVALGGSIFYTGLAFYLLSRYSPFFLTPWLFWLTSIVGGLGLEAYGKRFITNRQLLPVKSNCKPLLIYLMIIGLFFGLASLAPRPGLR